VVLFFGGLLACALLGLAIAGVIGIYTMKSDLEHFDPCPDPCPEQEEAVFYPRPECINYDPMRPPLGWPDQVAPWAQRGEIDPEIRCNLTPPLVNINATTAMYAYEKQDIDQNQGNVIFIDVRTHDEVYWIGVPTQVNSITLKNSTVLVPDYFIATLEPSCDDSDNLLHFTVQGQDVQIPASAVASSQLSSVSYNVPVEYVDTLTGQKTLNPLWGKQADAIIAETGADRIIFFCRSGQRSSVGCYYEFCPFQVLFPGILGMQMIAYEVETQVINGRGGFEGTDYSNSLLGYRGFPGRSTANLAMSPSASFKDAGLPMDTGMLPKTAIVRSSDGALLHLDELDAPAWANSP